MYFDRSCQNGALYHHFLYHTLYIGLSILRVALAHNLCEQGVLIYYTLSYISHVQPVQVDYRSGAHS